MTAYLWVKALHVIAIIAWMAALLYLPRLFVYHCSAPVGSIQSETFKLMERRLLRAIMTPAMVVVWLTGLYLVWSSGYYKAGWFHLKFLFVLILSGLHGKMSAVVRTFAEDRNQKSETYYRVLNEVPTLAMIVIVVAVIVKPF
jgi:putative membrane protein